MEAEAEVVARNHNSPDVSALVPYKNKNNDFDFGKDQRGIETMAMVAGSSNQVEDH